MIEGGPWGSRRASGRCCWPIAGSMSRTPGNWLAYAVNGDSVALPVNVSIDQGGTAYAISSKAPAVVEAQVETLRTKEFPIEVELNGKPDSDITLSDPVTGST